MKFLLTQHFLAFLFILIPLLLHFLRKSSLKQVPISSLYLFQRKEKKLFRHLKISHILLLLARLSIVFCLAVFFLQPVLPSASAFWRQLFPYTGQAQVFLDLSLDPKDSLVQFFQTNYGQKMDINYVALEPQKPLMAQIENITSHLLADVQTYLVSRFYGIEQTDLQRFHELGIQTIPFGAERIEKVQFLNLEVYPPQPFVGEKVQLFGQLFSNAPEQVVNVRLNTEQGYFDELFVNAEAHKNTGFSFELTADQPDLYRGYVELFDEKQAFQFSAKNELRIAFVDDEFHSGHKNSRLFYIRSFFQGLTNIFSHQVTFVFQDFQLSEFLQNKDRWDWVICGSIFSSLDGLQRRYQERFLVFRQKSDKSQVFWDNWFKMDHFLVENKTVNIELFPQATTSQEPFFQDWQAFRYLQVKTAGDQVYLASLRDTLCFASEQDIFSAFDWTKEEFSAVLQSSFPVFLADIFLDRPRLQMKSTPAVNLSRSAILFANRPNNTNLSDLSVLFLSLVFIFIGVEVFLMLKIEKIVSV